LEEIDDLVVLEPFRDSSEFALTLRKSENEKRAACNQSPRHDTTRHYMMLFEKKCIVYVGNMAMMQLFRKESDEYREHMASGVPESMLL
jgi:hypothetical protein